MTTYDSGLLSLPDDIIYNIFSLLDTEALKSCSLTGQVLSCWAKPFVHRTLHLIPRPRITTSLNVPDHWNELSGLPVLGERGLLQHTRHVSILRTPLFAHDLRPHIRHLHALTNLRSLSTRWLDTPAFNPVIEEYFGAFLETLESLELVYARGDHTQIFYFVCQFSDLRNLKIISVPGHTNSMNNNGPRFDIKVSPPLDGTLDLQLGMNTGPERDSMGAQRILGALVTLPSGLKFRTLKLSGCVGDNLQSLIDACAPTLERMEFTWEWFGTSFLWGGRPLFIGFDYQAPSLVLGSASNGTPRSERLKSK